MKIGVPKEIKDQEFRVGLTPAAVASLVQQGHQVWVETGAGLGSGFLDQAYEQAGAAIATETNQVYSQELVVKVKEPLESEYRLLHPNLVLFTYLHLAANRSLTQALLNSGATCIAYETVELANGQLPLLTPMSMIAGRLATQFGAHFLTRQQGGSGVLLGGIPGVRPGQVVILGGGMVGTEAAKIAVGLGARVQILDLNVKRLGELEQIFGSRVELIYSSPSAIAETVPGADLLIGAVLIPGRRAPALVSADLVATMRSRSVIVDVAVDQGGCVATMRPTSHSQPVFSQAGVIHYGVPNMPGAVPWTATQALVNATLPYIQAIAAQGLTALDQDLSLAKGLNIHQGKICHPAVQQVFADLT
ncbi:MAG: alanine dehydrogenase [Pseudanabaenaceae cyanobacterium bins.68]|nr:alanine dehydrogenase [Pseudanabaenaceae cyanobacterium bins.68]